MDIDDISRKGDNGISQEEFDAFKNDEATIMSEFAKWNTSVDIFSSSWKSTIIDESVSLNQITFTSDGSSVSLDMILQNISNIRTVSGLADFMFPIKCPSCGKIVSWSQLPPHTPFCSWECMTAYMLKSVSSLFHFSDEKADKIMKKIEKAIIVLNASANLLLSIPYFYQILPRIGELYANYILTRIYIGYYTIKKIVNEGLIMIHSDINEMLKEILLGVQKTDGVFQALNVGVQAINATLTACVTALDVLKQVVIAVSSYAGLEPESMSFSFTPRSMSYSPQQLSIRLNPGNSSNSIFDCIDIDKIIDMIKVTFPPIETAEYFYEPDIFDARLVLSDQNYKAIMKALKPLLYLLTLGSEPLPRYKNLKISNIWYLLFLLGGWGPASKQCFGMPAPAP